ncbi:hypothetical protein JCM3774_005088 [Rhodotorula dairenensis]
MYSSDEYRDMAEDTSDGEYDPPESSSSSTPTRSPTKRARHTRAQGQPAQTLAEPTKRTLSLFSLPAEIIDTILYDPDLRIHDHMILATTCRALRAVYYTPAPAQNSHRSISSPVWAALASQRPFSGEGRPTTWFHSSVPYPSNANEKRLKHLWSDRFDETKMAVLGSKITPERRKWNRTGSTYVVYPEKEEWAPVRSDQWEEGIADIAKQRITKTTAKKAYKLNDAELGRLPYIQKPNPHYRSAAPMQLYVEAAVERLAYKLHGGYQGQLQLLRKSADRAAKTEQTRRAKADGTWVPPTPEQTPKKSHLARDADQPAPTPGWRHLTPPPTAMSQLSPMLVDRDRSESPTLGPSRATRGHERDRDHDMIVAPQTPTRHRGKKRTLFAPEDEVEEDNKEKAPVLAQEEQQLPTPLSPLGGARDTYSFSKFSAGPNTPCPKVRRSVGFGAVVKKEEDGGNPSLSDGGADTNVQMREVGHNDNAPVVPSRSVDAGTTAGGESAYSSPWGSPPEPKPTGVPWLSPPSSGKAGRRAAGPHIAPVDRNEGQARREFAAGRGEGTETPSGRPRRSGAKKDYSVYA